MVLNAANRILPKEARLRPQDKRRWLGGSLLRPGSAERLGEQLGGYAAVQRILRLVSILRGDLLDGWTKSTPSVAQRMGKVLWAMWARRVAKEGWEGV